MSNSTGHEQLYSETGCPIHEVLPKDPTPFWENGQLNFKAHTVGWLFSGTFALIATITSIWLIRKHLQFFYFPSHQRHIVRILLMVPIYSIYSFLSYFYYEKAIYFQLIRDCYEAIVIGSFFYLLLAYLSSPAPTRDDPCPQPYPTRAEREEALDEVFRDFHLKKWMWPFGWVRSRPDGGGPKEGEGFLWWMRVGIGQYIILRPLTTLAAVGSEALGYYCLASWSPKFTHLYIAIIVCISVTVAMYNVLQLYMPFTKELKPYRPVLKFLVVKAVVFFTFWQESCLTWMISFGWIKGTEYWNAEQIVIGISAILSTFEMMIFSFMHISAFSYIPYRALAPRIDASLKENLEDGEEKVPKSHREWQKLERQQEEKQLQEKKLKRLPSLEDDGHFPTRADGTPLYRRTRCMPALWKCLKISDLFRAIKEEAMFVFAGGKVKRQTADRRREMETALGKGKRVKPDDSVDYDLSDDDNVNWNNRLANLKNNRDDLQNLERKPTCVRKNRHNSLDSPLLNSGPNSPRESPFGSPRDPRHYNNHYDEEEVDKYRRGGDLPSHAYYSDPRNPFETPDDIGRPLPSHQKRESWLVNAQQNTAGIAFPLPVASRGVIPVPPPYQMGDGFTELPPTKKYQRKGKYQSSSMDIGPHIQNQQVGRLDVSSWRDSVIVSPKEGNSTNPSVQPSSRFEKVGQAFVSSSQLAHNRGEAVERHGSVQEYRPTIQRVPTIHRVEEEPMIVTCAQTDYARNHETYTDRKPSPPEVPRYKRFTDSEVGAPAPTVARGIPTGAKPAHVANNGFFHMFGHAQRPTTRENPEQEQESAKVPRHGRFTTSEVGAAPIVARGLPVGATPAHVAGNGFFHGFGQR